MTPPKKNARPKALKPSVKSLIAKRAIEYSTYDRTLLANDLMKEIEELGETAPTEDTLIKYISDARGRYSVDKPWNTASLNIEPITPEALPWLILIQENRKIWLSKMLTQREAKWFNRLSGYRNLSPPSVLTDMGIESPDSNLVNIYQSAIVATWAQIYAYREMIDAIAGIKEPDFSDLDSYLLNYNLGDLIPSEVEQTFGNFDSVLKKIEREENPNKRTVTKVENRIESGVLSFIRVEEIYNLNHSLGTPDMSPESILLYFFIMVPDYIADRLRGLTYHTLKDPQLNVYYMILPEPVIKIRAELTYVQRIDYFVDLRQWCKEHPEALKVRPENFEVEMLAIISSIVKEDEPK